MNKLESPVGHRDGLSSTLEHVDTTPKCVLIYFGFH
jgi:hypothetical protein